MTTTQAIKLLKNGEAQLYVEYATDDKSLFSKILTECVGTDILETLAIYKWHAIFGNTLSSGFLKHGDLPIIKLSEIEQECMECRVDGDALYQCDACYEQAVKNHVCDYHCENGGFCLKRSDENMKRVLREINYTRRDRPNKAEKLAANLKVCEELFEQIQDFQREQFEKEWEKINEMWKKQNDELLFESIVSDAENIIEYYKNQPNTETMQVTTNENGEITLSGITIDNDTVDRIVAIWKEQTERAKMPEMNKWHKSFRGHLYFFKEVIGNNKYIESYGFNSDGKWSDSTHRDYDALSKYEPATDQEVTEALTKEAVKRGYNNGNYKCLAVPNETMKVDEKFFVDPIDENANLWMGKSGKCNMVFEKGVWATIIEKPTYTHADLEKKLGETFNYKGE